MQRIIRALEIQAGSLGKALENHVQVPEEGLTTDVLIEKKSSTQNLRSRMIRGERVSETEVASTIMNYEASSALRAAVRNSLTLTSPADHKVKP